jgi:4-phytase/acid phosphatase
VAALLGLHWTLDGRRDDTPPGTELAFELWQNERGAYTVRVTVAMQTLNQMRQSRELTLAAPPDGEVLMVQGCDAKSQSSTETTSFKRFKTDVRSRRRFEMLAE